MAWVYRKVPCRKCNGRGWTVWYRSPKDAMRERKSYHACPRCKGDKTVLMRVSDKNWEVMP